ncbi:hypothetical protein DFH28DRAFT_1110826 [Melampsora americana]|nr:hypothetical protein DFH28DRAFT_1110826 [Melampsora americana]
MQTCTTLILILWRLSHIWGIPMENLNIFHHPGSMESQIITKPTTNVHFSTTKEPLPIWQDTKFETPDKIPDRITAQEPNHEGDQIYHTPYTATDLKGFESPYSGTFSENQPLHESDFTHHLWNHFNDDHHVSIDDLFSISHNPEIDESQHKDASQDFRQVSENFKTSSMWESHHQMEQPSTISPRLNSFPEDHLKSVYNGFLEPQDSHHSGTDFPQLFREIPNWEDSLMHIVGYPDMTSIRQQDMIQSHPINNDLNPTLPNPVGSEGSSHNTGMGRNPAYRTMPDLNETHKNDDTRPGPSFQGMGLNHIECIENGENHCPSSSGKLGETLRKEDTVGHISKIVSRDTDLDYKNKRKNTASQAKRCTKLRSASRRAPESTKEASVENEGSENDENEIFENERFPKNFSATLVRSIIQFGESNHLSSRKSITGDFSFLHQMKNLIVKPTDDQDLWGHVEWAYKVLNVPFIALLLILHPESFTEKSSKDVLIQDGMNFINQVLSQLYMAGLKLPFNAREKHSVKYFDISEPFALLGYTIDLYRSDRVNITTLWKLWQRWYRSSTYPNKTVVLGLRKFSTLIQRNLMNFRSSTDGFKLQPALENFNLDHVKKKRPAKSGTATDLTWQAMYRPTRQIGKEQYNMLTLRVASDEFFDQLDDALKSKSLSDHGQFDSGLIQRVEGYVRKLHNELTPLFFGSLVALNSIDANHQNLDQGLIDDGWKFFKHFLDVFQRTFPTNVSELEGVETMEKEAVCLTLTFFKKRLPTATFSMAILTALLNAWLNQSSYPNKNVLGDTVDVPNLLKMIHVKNQLYINARLDLSAQDEPY